MSNNLNIAILTKQTSKGDKLEITIERSPFDSARLTTFLNGAKLERLGQLFSVEGLPGRRNLPAGITHVVGRVGLTDAEAEIVRAAVAEAQRVIDLEPAVALRKLRTERQGLADAISGWEDEQQNASDRAWEQEDEAGAYHGPAVLEAQSKAAQARRALAEFDRAHPEVIADILHERAESADRHAWD